MRSRVDLFQEGRVPELERSILMIDKDGDQGAACKKHPKAFISFH